MPVNKEKKQAGGKFTKGQSGNPRGRPRGARNKTTMAAQALLYTDLESICHVLLSKAGEGNMQAIKLILDRILPSRGDHPLTIYLPDLVSREAAIHAIRAVIQAVARGTITPNEGNTLVGMVEAYLRALHFHDTEERLARLEERIT